MSNAGSAQKAWRQGWPPPRKALRVRRQRGGRKEYDGSASRQFRKVNGSRYAPPASWLRCRSLTGAFIATVEAPCPTLIDHRLARVDVRTQVMAGNAVEAFSFKHILRWQLFRLVQPSPNRGLAYTEIARKLRLRAGLINRCVESFKSGWLCIHMSVSIGKPIDRSSGKIGWRVITSPIGDLA